MVLVVWFWLFCVCAPAFTTVCARALGCVRAGDVCAMLLELFSLCACFRFAFGWGVDPPQFTAWARVAVVASLSCLVCVLSRSPFGSVFLLCQFPCGLSLFLLLLSPTVHQLHSLPLPACCVCVCLSVTVDRAPSGAG